MASSASPPRNDGRNQLTHQRLSPFRKTVAMPTALQSARKLKSRLAAITMNRLGLRDVSTEERTTRRKRAGEGFTFVDAGGRTVRDELTRARLKKLAVPPAY